MKKMMDKRTDQQKKTYRLKDSQTKRQTDKNRKKKTERLKRRRGDKKKKIVFIFAKFTFP